MYSASDRHLGIFQYGQKSSGGNDAKMRALEQRIAELEARNRQLSRELQDCKSQRDGYKTAAERAKLAEEQLKAQLAAKNREAAIPPRQTKATTQTNELSDEERARLAMMKKKQFEAGIKMLRKIMASWLAGSIRGYMFNWQSNWRTDKEEQQRLGNLSAAEKAAMAARKVHHPRTSTSPLSH